MLQEVVVDEITEADKQAQETVQMPRATQED
jgi:hypothetical protein